MTTAHPNNDIGFLLNDIEEKCNPRIGDEECHRFSMDCLALIRHRLPAIGVEAMRVLDEYKAGHAERDVLDKMYIKCWQYLRENCPEQKLSDPKFSSIRAVLFPLDAQRNPEPRDILNHVVLFLQFINNVEPHMDSERELLKKYFYKCL